MLHFLDDFADAESMLSRKIKEAELAESGVYIAGGGTRPFVGRSKSASSHLQCLGTEALQGVLSYEPSELVVRIGAGTKIADLKSLLEDNNQRLAFEPHDINHAGQSTIGGALACNMAGAARPWMGGVKDHVLGLGLINGLGQKLNFGGQVMKNVAGYDVSRMMTGSLGCFGLITDVSLKVLPMSNANMYLSGACDLTRAIELACQLDKGMNSVSGLAWYEGYVYLRLSGVQPALESVAHTLNASGFELSESTTPHEIWGILNTQNGGVFDEELARDDARLWRVSAPKYSDLSSVLDASPYLMNWAGAEYWVRASVDAMSSFLPALQEMQAQVYSWSCDEMYTLEPMSLLTQRLHMNLKNAFDPHSVFSAKRMSEHF